MVKYYTNLIKLLANFYEIGKYYGYIYIIRKYLANFIDFLKIYYN